MNRNSNGMDQEDSKAFDDIVDVLCSITDSDEMKSLLDDVFTEAELKDVVHRWLLMDDLYRGMPQRDIAAKRNMSLCKITRGSKILKNKNGFMRKLLSSRYDDHLHL